MKTTFTKGIHTATDPVNTPPEYYRDAENFRISGNSKRSEEGMTHMVGVPSNFIIWGNCAIGDQTILLGQINSKSVIGSLDKDDNWVVEVPARVNEILGIVEPTQVEGKKNWAGERIIYFSTSSGARRINLGTIADGPDLPTGDTDFDKVTSLFLEYDLPKVNYTGESSGGTLLSGSYQLGARLVTESGASTAFGIVSNVIPVVPSSLQSERGSIVGAAPQTATTKALLLSITNIDTSFKYIEIGILTYTGLANIPVLTVSNRININNQSTIQYTYRGASDDYGTLSIDEFIISGVSYVSGEFLAQKDGTLILGAPKESTQPNIDWHRVADGMVSEFVVKTIAYKEQLAFQGSGLDDSTVELGVQELVETSQEPLDDGYKNPLTCTLYKGYRRNEVYAFTLTPVFTSGVYGPTVHIPAGHASATPANTPGAADDGGTLGTYISEEKYPDDRYPSIAANTGLRLHKFPDADTQPLLSGNVETGNMYFRVLGVKFSNIVLDASETEYSDLIAGFIIGRVNRVGNETQLAQGLVRPNGNIIHLNSVRTRCTMLGDGFMDWSIASEHEGGDSTGIAERGHTNSCYPDIPNNDVDDFTFVAPDIIHGLYNADQATHIKQFAGYKANPYTAPTSFVKTDAGSNTKKIWDDRNDDWARTAGIFKNITGESSFDIGSRAETALDGVKPPVYPFGVPRASHTNGGKENTTIQRVADELQMCSSDGFVWMHTLGDITLPNYRHALTHHKGMIGNTGDKYDGFTELLPNTTRVDMVVHALTRVDPKQYGALDQMVSMYTTYQDWKTMSGDEVEFFNGDTFINKYGLTLNDEGFWPYGTDDNSESPFKFQGHLRPANCASIVYFWLESSNNYAYRHYIQPTSFSVGNVDSANGSTPFYPAYKRLLSGETPFGIMSMYGENWIRPGYASQYNNQYSAQPTFKPFAVTPKEDIEQKASLVNRIVYSATAVQGEKTDAYQLFLPNNFYDVPQEFGELTDVYVFHELYASTNQVQWKLYFNTLATQATNVGEIVLGTGGAFNRPATPMVTVDGGYGGTAHWLHAINTIYGRVFVDRYQGKFFMLNQGLQYFSGDLDDTDRLEVQALENDDIRVGSEPLRERVFIKVGSEKIWSYNLERKVFVSRHTYYPRWMFSHGPHMYSNYLEHAVDTAKNGIYKHSVGITGMYYGELHPAFITIVANAGKEVSKQFKNLEILSERITEAGLNIPFYTFNQMKAWNKERNTGLLNINPKTNAFQIPGIMEVLAAKVKDSFRLTMSRDVVIDPQIDIFAVGNHAQKIGDATLTKWLPKMRGTYIEIKLITDNTQGPIFLFDVLTEVSENIR